VDRHRIGRGRAACARLDRYRRNDRRVSNCDFPDPGGVLCELSTSSAAGNPHASKKLQSAHWIPLFPCNESYLLVYLDNIRKPVLVIALGLVATGCAHLANVTTTQPGVPRLMLEEEQLQSATEHLARAKADYTDFICL
jgi:hypothetical protein